MERIYRILTINPGSTSTKIALFENEERVFADTVSYDAQELGRFPSISDQLPYRLLNIDKALEENNIDLSPLDACVGRGGSLMSMEGGTYLVDDLLHEHARAGINGVYHPAQLGVQIAGIFGRRYNCPVYTVNPPEVDEFTPEARVTGISGIIRESHLHALSQKETAIRHAKSIGRGYEDCNFIVCHLGGGISIAAHRRGRMIDGNDIAMGLGPIAPTRCGTIPAAYLLEYMEKTGKTPGEVKSLCIKTGGVVSLLGTSDMKQIEERAVAGDARARLVWDAMIYGVCKEIGAMSAVLKGRVDGILLSGGLAHSELLENQIREAVSFIGPVTVYPGEFEMEALASGALRVLRGQEKAKRYSGKSMAETIL